MGDEDDDLAAEWAAALGEDKPEDKPEADPADDWAAAMEEEKAEKAEKAAAQIIPQASPGGGDMETVEAVYDIPVEIIAVLGTASMPISQILKLGRGAVVELERIIGEPIEIHANNRLVARGEVVVVEDRLGVQITEIIRMT